MPEPMPQPKDTLIREIPRIRRYARHNEAADNRFAAFVKTRLDRSNADLDAEVQEITDRVWSQIDCLTCGNCCKSLEIVIDDRDIQRLATRLSLTQKEFAKRYVQIAEDGVKLFNTTPCPFLGEDNACAVYEDRPRACRDFPYLHAPIFRSRMGAMLENLGTCPIVFNVWAELKTRYPKGK